MNGRHSRLEVLDDTLSHDLNQSLQRLYYYNFLKTLSSKIKNNTNAEEIDSNHVTTNINNNITAEEIDSNYLTVRRRELENDEIETRAEIL